MTFPPELLSLLRGTSNLTALTGAGVSQESGLRTFRDIQNGLWAQYKPEDLASPEAFARDPGLVWGWYTMRREAVKAVRPNPGHYALVEIEKRIPQFNLITQNVDGLHGMAGNRNVYELHGNIQRVRCSRCGESAPSWDEDIEPVPMCKKCGGLLRPDVVWFGESLPSEALTGAVTAAGACEVFMSIGTSGVVQPAASLWQLAKQSGAVVIEVNAEATPVTNHADYFVQGRSGLILPELVRAVWN